MIINRSLTVQAVQDKIAQAQIQLAEVSRACIGVINDADDVEDALTGVMYACRQARTIVDREIAKEVENG